MKKMNYINLYNSTSLAPAYAPDLDAPDLDIEKKTLASAVKRQEMKLGISQLQKLARRERRLMLCKCFVALSVVVAMFAFMLHRQTKIVELNLSNNERLVNVKETQEEAEQVTKKLLASVDLDDVAELAEKKFKMQTPSPEKIIFLQLNEADKIVYYMEKSKQEEDSLLNSEDIKTIENYRRTLQKDGQD